MFSVEAILFDLDGTLIDSQQDIALSVHHLQKKYGCPPSPQTEITQFIGDGVGKLVERAIGARSPEELEKAVDVFKDHYRQHALDHTYIYPGVQDTLAHFRAKKMAVVTNKPVRVSQRILQGLGLASYFPVILGGDSLSRKKPHPDMLLHAMDQLGALKPKAVMMVGDGAQDILAGRAAGIKTCGIFSNIGDPQLLKDAKPDYTVRSMPDLMRIIN